MVKPLVNLDSVRTILENVFRVLDVVVSVIKVKRYVENLVEILIVVLSM